MLLPYGFKETTQLLLELCLLVTFLTVHLPSRTTVAGMLAVESGYKKHDTFTTETGVHILCVLRFSLLRFLVKVQDGPHSFLKLN